MNRLVIVGNGFDLAHGLKTSYVDFLLTYFTKAIEYAMFNKSGYSDILFKIDHENAKKFQRENKLGELSTFNCIKIILEYKDINKRSLISYQSDYLSQICKTIESNSWFDIERIYSNNLDDLHEALTKSRSINEKEMNKTKIKNLNREFNHLKNKLIEYIESEDESSNSKQLSDLVDNILFGEFNRKNTSTHQNKVFILCFNYTNLISRYIEEKNQNIVLKHIHGKVHTKVPVIFGYGDSASKQYQSIINSDEVEFTKHFKSFMAHNNDSYSSLINFIKEDGFELIIAGHSCGSSDSYILSKIVSARNCISIKILYHKKEDGSNDYSDKRSRLPRHYNSPDFPFEKILPFSDSDCLTTSRLS